MNRDGWLAIIMDVGGEYDRALICAIANVGGARYRLDLRLFTQGRYREVIDSPQGLRGVFFGPTTETMFEDIKNLNLPQVDLVGALLDTEICTVVSDNQQIGRLAAEHLAEQGIPHFGYVGRLHYRFGQERLRGMVDELARRGYDLGKCMHQLELDRRMAAAETEPQLPLLDAVAEFLQRVKKPIGILAEEDRLGSEVVRVATALGLDVPKQVSVIGVDDDPVSCQLSNPWLSSIRQDTGRIGALAVKDMMRQIDGDRKPRIHRVAPIELHARGSSDYLRSGDPELAKAVLFIREHAVSPLSVDEVVDWTAVSRRTLESRFRKELGRTILDEIRQTRVRRSIELLLKTDQSISQIAGTCGFSSTQRFSTVFREITSYTPSDYRKIKRDSADGSDPGAM